MGRRPTRSRRRAAQPLPRRGEPPARRREPEPPPAPGLVDEAVDLADVRGQVVARRALEIALAGSHALLLIGPPGSGKTLLARTIPDVSVHIVHTEATITNGPSVRIGCGQIGDETSCLTGSSRPGFPGTL